MIVNRGIQFCHKHLSLYIVLRSSQHQIIFALPIFQRNAKKSAEKVKNIEEEIEDCKASIEKLETEFKDLEEQATTVLQSYEGAQVKFFISPTLNLKCWLWRLYLSAVISCFRGHLKLESLNVLLLMAMGFISCFRHLLSNEK